MRLAETVTFGGSGLDRAAALRGMPEQWGETRTICLWRGKVALDADGHLLALSRDKAPKARPDSALLFLGRDDREMVWLACDLDDWSAARPDPGFFDQSEHHHPDLPAGHRLVELRGVMTLLTPREAEFAATARAMLGWHQSHGFCSNCGAQTRIEQAGWQSRCPSCGRLHFPRTDPVVIMLITDGNDLLLGRSPQWPEGMYSLLAGFVEPGEPVEAAVRREVFEETGVEVGQVSYLASQPWPFPMSLMLGCHGQALSRDLTLDPQEIEDALWVNREELLRIQTGSHPKIRPARRGAIAHFLMHNWLADRLD